MSAVSNSRKIVKNTLFLYFRMFITIVVGLYTSRVVLQTLGASDFGVYTLVGGIVLMTSFLNAGMMQASQRFMSYALGKGDEQEIHETFSTSVLTHILIAVIVVVFAETVGLYVVQQLNIPPERMWAANWVYQCSIFTFVASVLSVPYNSTIVAHEHMNFYAYISILEVTLKLVILFLLAWSPYDKLISYAILYLSVQVLIRFVYSIYCGRHFMECRQRLIIRKEKIIEMFRFAGWSIVGNFGFSFRDQGTSIILNLFFGTIVNAARGVATSVSTVINHFATNTTLAFNPPIVKSYAAGNYDESVRLVYMGSRMAFYLLTFITIPFLTHVDFILELWLGTVPENTSLFLYFILCVSLIYSMSQPVTVAIQATGRIRTFQIWICALMLSELALAYIILHFTHNLAWSLAPSILSNLAALIVRFYIIRKMVPQYRWKDYLVRVFLKCWGIYAICFCLIHYSTHYIIKNTDIFTLVISIPLEVMTIALIIYLMGLTSEERSYILKKIPIFNKKQSC